EDDPLEVNLSWSGWHTLPIAEPPAEPTKLVQAVRGATQIPLALLKKGTPLQRRKGTLLRYTAELLAELLARNALSGSSVVSAVFTSTPDIARLGFPAEAARTYLGWTDVPLMCAGELPVAGALPRCVRVLLTVATSPHHGTLTPVYLHGAQK